MDNAENGGDRPTARALYVEDEFPNRHQVRVIFLSLAAVLTGMWGVALALPFHPGGIIHLLLAMALVLLVTGSIVARDGAWHPRPAHP